MNDANTLLAYAATALALIQTGRTTWLKLRDLLAKEGATDEELAALDAALTAAIAAREATDGGLTG